MFKMHMISCKYQDNYSCFAVTGKEYWSEKKKNSIGFTSQRENYNGHVALNFGVVLNPNS